jgi:hypothetical protein
MHSFMTQGVDERPSLADCLRRLAALAAEV